eukprot:COSAG01_NODE_1227_length_11135_cov_33.369337_4_plen_116_part_00
MPTRSELISELKKLKVRGALSKMKKADLQAKLTQAKAASPSEPPPQPAPTKTPRKPKKPTIELEPAAAGSLNFGTWETLLHADMWISCCVHFPHPAVVGSHNFLTTTPPHIIVTQ